jgi:hypothetical protein
MVNTWTGRAILGGEMKLYSDAPQASIKMSDDPALVAAVEAAIKTYGTRIAIETGTFEGTGSTRIIADGLRRAGQPITYVTIEVSFENWCTAYHNLRPFLFVDCRWGCSVDKTGAIEFIRKDDAIKDHHKYPDIYIDDVNNPVLFYTNELNGITPFSQRARNWIRTLAAGNLRFSTVNSKLWSGESLLPQLLRLHHDNQPLIVLDSAGGCGWYEFKVMMDIMRDTRFLLLLDDTHHLKHFRSLRHVKADSRFRLLTENAYHGWALAWHE